MDSREVSLRIKLKTPCPMKWSEMSNTGDARVRHCGACRLNVYNVNEMTTPEVEALLATGGQLCGLVYRRKDGTVVPGDCRRVWQQKRADATSALGTAVTVGGVFLCLVMIAFFTFTLFGDNIRRMFGSSAGGLSGSPPPTFPGPMPSAKFVKKGIKDFGNQNTY